MAHASDNDGAQPLAEFHHQCDQIMFWINYKEVIVWPEELGSAKDSEAAFKEKYSKFMEEINAQEFHLNETLATAENLILKYPGEMEIVMRRREELKQSWQRMRKLALKRQHFGQTLAEVQNAPIKADPSTKTMRKVAAESQRLRGLLEEFLRLEEFHRDGDATKNWITQTLAVCNDNNHLDMKDLSLKNQNHKKLQDELASHQRDIDILAKIQCQLKQIAKMWETLLKASQLKGVHLAQAWQQEKFNQGVDNMNDWLAEVEKLLSHQEFGTDMDSVELLIKEHTLLEQDVRNHHDVLEIILTSATQFMEQGHFDLKSILARKAGVVERFAAMRHSVVERQRKLGDSLRAQQLYRDIEIEETWIADKEKVIAGRGQDIDSVRKMIQETQGILVQMKEHEDYLQKVIKAGHKLADTGVYKTGFPDLISEAAIRERTKLLSEHWVELKEKAFQRKQSNQLVLLFLFNIKD